MSCQAHKKVNLMKYYSEKLDKLFDSPEALADAEAGAKKRGTKKAAVEKTVAEEPAQITRKQLAADVEAADEAVKEAYANYETAKVKAEELSKKYLAEVNEILEPAQKAVKDAERVRYEAIKKFNDNFGAYQVTYTGARAADEMMKAFNNMNARANKLFRDMFWI